jgi:hypothetical protein
MIGAKRQNNSKRKTMVYVLRYLASATDVYNKSGLTVTESDITANDSQLINDGEEEVEVLTGRKFTNSNSITETLDGPKLDVIGTSGQKARTINLSFYPILTITSFLILNVDGTTNTTYAALSTGTETIDYWMDSQEDPLTRGISMNGKIILKNTEFPPGNRNIKVTYTYGYSTIPHAINNLACCLIGIRQWVKFLGGSYNYLNSYSIPQQSVSKGDLFQRGKQMIDSLTSEANAILDRVGRRPRRLFFASGMDR